MDPNDPNDPNDGNNRDVDSPRSGDVFLQMSLLLRVCFQLLLMQNAATRPQINAERPFSR